jgi:MoxR-like ATPase
MAPATLAHRLVLVPEADVDPKARDTVIDEAVQRVGYRRAARPA